MHLSKTLARITRIVLILIFLLAVGLLSLVFFVDPNNYKPQITQLISEKTGQTLTIDGKINWSFFPGIGVEINRVSLKPEASHPLYTVQAKRFTTQIRLLPLLWKEVHVQKLHLENAHVSLKTKDTHHNIPIRHLTLTDLTYADTDSVLDAVFDVDLEVETLPIQAHGQIHAVLKQPVFDLNRFSSTIDGIQLEGDASVQLANWEALDNPSIQLALRSNTLTLAKWYRLFEIETSDVLPTTLALDLKTRLQNHRAHIQNIELKTDKGAYQLKGTLNLGQKDFLPTKLDLTYTGKNVMVDKLKLDSIEGKIAGVPSKKLSLPVTMKAYGGQQQLDIQYLPEKNRALHIVHTATQPNVAPLLAALGHPDKLSGALSLNGTYDTQGETAEARKQNLSAKLKAQLQNGAVHGVDLPDILAQVQDSIEALYTSLKSKNNFKSLISTQVPKWQKTLFSKEAKSTPFESFSTEISLKNSVLMVDSFEMADPAFFVSGYGQLNLLPETGRFWIKAYSLTHRPQSDTLQKMLQEVPIVLDIKGPFNKPKVRPNFEIITKSILRFYQQEAKTEVRHKAVEKLQKKIKLPVESEKLNETLDKVFEKLKLPF